MIITCEQCQARFRMADEKLKPGGTKVRCSKCKHIFTVMPPEPPQTEESIDYGEFNMERLPGEETAPVPEPPPAPPAQAFAAPPAAAFAAPPAAATPTGDLEVDFSGLEQSMGPGSDTGEPTEEFSFADTAAATEPPAGEETGAYGAELGRGPAELDFDATFAETEEPAATTAAPPMAGPAEFAFDQELARGEADGADTDAAAFDFAAAAETRAPGGFEFPTETEETKLSEFGFETESGEESFTFGETPPSAETASTFEFGSGDSFETAVADSEPSFSDETVSTEPAEGFEFGSGDSFETSAADSEPSFSGETVSTGPAEGFEFGSGDSFETSVAAEPAFGEAWDQPEKEGGLSFDFDEPNFETQTEEKVAKGKEEAGLSFGEIDFSNDEGEAVPGFGSEPDFSQAALARPAETESAPPPPPPPPMPRPAAERPRGAEMQPPPTAPRKSPISRVLLLLVVLLAALCGAAGYFFFMGNGQEIVAGLIMKIKGEEPAAPVEQRIGLNITGSSYVNNREAGQLLVIQGTATNNFTTTRTAISVKGVLLDAAGRVLQQQTVFCGNYLDEEKLRTLKYAQIEEAMNNQFGDSLSNMNVTPGKVLRFTIVFRNVPKEMANINVEVVDSKPGGS